MLKKRLSDLRRLLLLCATTALNILPSLAADYTIQVKSPRQTIAHFGASDAWSMQTIGLWDNVDAQEQIADWLFSLETDGTGKPKGIGLSLWRFNLGAGSQEQGDDSHINRSTRTECFLRPDSTYDFSRQAGQRRFLRMARQRGVPYFLAFTNSPPVYFTENGLATNTGRHGTLNLKADHYDDFARFMAHSLKGLEEIDGVHFDYLCPVNEPDGHWNWQGPKQEGSPATNREIARLARLTDRALTDEGLTTLLLVNESSDLRCLLGIHETSWDRGNTISTLFSQDSTITFLGNLPHVPALILGHSYWTNTPVPYMREIREQLRDTCSKYGIGFWQSELCIMQNDTEIGGGEGYDFSMKTALYVARVIHHDLKYADAGSWSWWRACGGNYKDGLLRVYDREQRAQDSKLLWAFGNYSRFIRPGAVHYEVSGPEEDPYGLMVTAFRNQNGQWVVVALNYSDEAADFGLSLDNGEQVEWQAYRTSDGEGEDLKPVPASQPLPPRSVTTFVAI